MFFQDIVGSLNSLGLFYIYLNHIRTYTSCFKPVRMIFFHPTRERTCYHCKKSMKPLLRGLFLLAAIYLAVCFGSTIAIVNIFPNATALTVFIVNICWTVLLFALRPFFVIFKANEQKKR